LSRLNEHDRITFDELIRTELSGHGVIAGNSQDGQVTLDGPSGIRLPSSIVQTFALALHELATNALKYGALSAPDGHLTVMWRLVEDGEPRLHVEWRETGVATGEDGGKPARVGYGRELIERALPFQLQAETSYELGPDGVSCAMTVPISTQDDARDGGFRAVSDRRSPF
jgi:two-component sensor histidine kinase